MRILSDKGGCSENVLDKNSIDDPLQNITHRFKNHPSIISINDNVTSSPFDLMLLTEEEVSAEISKINRKKSTTRVSIGLLKENSDI